MTESEVLFQISNIVNGHLSFSRVQEQITLLLEKEACGKGVFIDSTVAPNAAMLLDSFSHPYRSLFTVDLRDAGVSLGKITLLFASDKFQGSLPQRLSTFVGEQLGMLLARTRLAERREELKQEIAAMKEDLSTRKLMQRAEGLLIACRGLLAISARRWIAQQSQKTGLSKSEIADRVVAYYQATGLREQKIA
jgi:DNA-binding transcriptional MerR regulator